MPGGQQPVLDLGHEHGFHQGGSARDGFALEHDRLKLELDVIGLLEALIVGGIGLQTGVGLHLAAVQLAVARPQGFHQTCLAALQILMAGGIERILDDQHPGVRLRESRSPAFGHFEYHSAPLGSAIPVSIQ